MSTKHNFIKNNFNLYQIKRLIGKKLLIVSSLIPITIQMKNSSKIIKSKILDVSGNSIKNLIITTTCSNGILYVIKNVENFLAISSISYKEIDSLQNTNINVVIVQYQKLSKKEIKDII